MMDLVFRSYMEGTGDSCPVCAKSVKSRMRLKRNEEPPPPESEDESGLPVGDRFPRPERLRRWDHLRKIHFIGVCTLCSKYVPRAHMAKHRIPCGKDVKEAKRAAPLAARSAAGARLPLPPDSA